MFREASQIKKTNITLGELKHNEVLRRQLYHDLKHALPPKEKLDLPFDTSPKTRKEAILKTVSLCHNVADIKYGNRFGLYNSDDRGVMIVVVLDLVVIARTIFAFHISSKLLLLPHA